MNFIRSIGKNQEPLLPSEVRHEPLPRQVVTLAFLSGQIPISLISEKLAQSLGAETEASVVLVRLEPQEDSSRTNSAARSEPFLNGEFHMPPEVRRTDGGFHAITLGVRSDPPTPAGIESLVNQLRHNFRYVLIETQINESPAPWFSDLLLRSNLAFVFHQATEESADPLNFILREARARQPQGGVQVKPVACLVEGEPVTEFELLAQRIASPVNLFVRNCPSQPDAENSDPQASRPDFFHADLRRIAREIGGCLVGLALSSGAAKGFAHIGVIQVLEENGIEVDVIAGTSMGAYVGSLWAHGCDGRELERLARELEERWALWSLIDPAFPPRRGFIRGFAVKKRLMRSIGHVRFAELVRPLRVVAANLATLERVVFSSGEVASAVHASTAVPGICVPVTLDGEIFTDGGIVDPLPVDVLREMGVSKVIAVNVIPTPERIRYGIEAELDQAQRGGTDGHRLIGKMLPLNRKVNYFARGNLLEILMRSVHGAQIRMAEASCRQADLVLRPDIFDDRWLDYRSPGRFITLGREAAERNLEAIKSLVERKETIHEQKLAPESVAAAI